MKFEKLQHSYARVDVRPIVPARIHVEPPGGSYGFELTIQQALDLRNRLDDACATAICENAGHPALPGDREFELPKSSWWSRFKVERRPHNGR